MTNFSVTFVLFCMLYSTNIPAIPIWMGQSAGSSNFNFTEFKECNTGGILCLYDTKVSGHVIQLTNSTTADYKSTNQTTGRVTYCETIPLSSIASFTTKFQFVMRYYNVSFADEGGGGIAFFITSKQTSIIATSGQSYSGLPGNESHLSPDMLAVEFYNHGNSSRVYTKLGSFSPVQVYNYTKLDYCLNDGTIWNAWIDYDTITKTLQVFLSNTSSGSNSQRNRVLAHPIDSSKFLPEHIVPGLSSSARESSETHTIISWSFNSKTKTRKTSKKLIIILCVVGLCFCFAAAGVICGYYFIIVKKKRSGTIGRETFEDNEMDIEKLLEHGLRRFKLDDLKAGTNNFCETQKLGQGGFGGVYKGIVGKPNEVIAVKRISEGSRQGIKEFISEVSIVSRVRHRNLVQILGWCHERGQLLLVYEYMPNGSLDKHLFSQGDNPSLKWSCRYSIARQIASGLLYLHEECDRCVVHRDVKSSNVMLDCDFNAKLGDFGLARILEHDHLCQTTMAAGTLGYLAPECAITGRTSPESDVYSYGAVALEIATGRPAVDMSLIEHDMRLVEWVWDLYGQGNALEAADMRLNGDFNRAEMEQLIAVGLWCSHPDAAARPKMTQVVKLLKMEAEAPHLPSAIPVPTYSPFQGTKLSVASSFFTGSSYTVPSSSSHSTSSTCIPGTTTQVFSSNPNIVHKAAFFRQEAEGR